MTSTMVGSTLLALRAQKMSPKPAVGGKWISRYEVDFLEEMMPGLGLQRLVRELVE